MTTPGIENRKHHPFGPSKMNYLDDCSAFESRSGTNEAAEEGIMLHSIMDALVQRVLKGECRTTLEQIGETDRELTDQQLDCLRFCCKRTDGFLLEGPDAIYTELGIAVRDPDEKLVNHGYLDVLLTFGAVGIIQDYKFGWEPVRPAETNLQGLNYAVGCFQRFSKLEVIGVEFPQPRLGSCSAAEYCRKDLDALRGRLEEVIKRVQFVRATPSEAQQYMRPGYYCEYCNRSGDCAVLANHRGMAVSKYANLPMPPAFSGLQLTRPEDLALARYWVSVIETGFEGVKEKAMAVAEANGGRISCTLANGQEIVYEVQERNMDRSLGKAVEVAECLKDFVSPMEVLGAADLAITKLEPICKNALVELALSGGEKLTKKAAWERIQATLEANGLLSRPEGKIRFLKLKKAGLQQQQIENT